MSYRKIRAQISEVNTHNFDALALEIFHYQATHSPIYKAYIELLGIDSTSIQSIQQIPFLPIECFKNFEVKTGDWLPEVIFTSSGTTGQQPSSHFVQNLEAYLQNTRRGFEAFYGKLEDYCILALLPAYLERQGSSLVAMADYFIRLSKYSQSGFFLNNIEKLSKIVQECQASRTPTLLLGVSFALLDLGEQYPMDLSQITIMETGGMKGRRKEIVRSELHSILQTAFNTQQIHSEYGMTELLSQAYSKGDGLFYPSSTMKIIIRDVSDPLAVIGNERTGGINIIDLANIDSCAFIATQDLGKTYPDGSFEVLGRFDFSDVRGCNLMINDFRDFANNNLRI